MRPIPKKLLNEMLADPFYKTCIYQSKGAPNHDCRGRITLEHAWKYQGRQINEKWAIVPCCLAHNSGEAMDKRYNEFRALERADITEVQNKYPKRDWWQELHYLQTIYKLIKNI